MRELIQQAIAHQNEILIVVMTVVFLVWRLTPPAVKTEEPEVYEPVLYRRIE
jgi:hypothetical protein